MPRKAIIRNSTLPYHVFNRVISRDFYPPNKMDKIWSIYCDAARIVSWSFGANIHALVLMSNHYHMLISTPDQNIDIIMMHFQREISRHVTRAAFEQRYRFQGRYKWDLIQSSVHYDRVYRYIAHNPVEAGLVSRPSDYPFSSISFEFGNIQECCPIFTKSHLSDYLSNDVFERWETIEPDKLQFRPNNSSINWKELSIVTPTPAMANL